jgi:hypothetical protein
MKTPSLFNLESLTDLRLHGGVDMRPTLLRVLTDLYVQKPLHTPEEERHYTELALRLVEAVDAATRATVASRLAAHSAPPLQVLAYLTGERRTGATSPPPPHPAADVARGAAPPGKDFRLEQQPSAVRRPAPHRRRIGPDAATELNELFFAADAQARRLILLNLETVAALSVQRPDIPAHPSVGKRLEAAALARSREGFAQQLAVSLNIAPAQALRIARDDLGEPIVVAAKALNVPRELLYRILLFVNTAIGHSVERVHTLADLYDEMTVRAAEDMVAVWQALPGVARVGRHHPVLWNDEARARVRPTSVPVRRAPSGQQSRDRRDAS